MLQRDVADQDVGNDEEQKPLGRAPDQGGGGEDAGLPQATRSTISFLISAMALAGLRSFGQASVQFMMV